jgi:hypothetical protein
LFKKQKWFLTTDDYTSLYLQYTYMPFKIYKRFYKNRNILSQMKENLRAGHMEQTEVPEIQIRADDR